MLNFDILDKGLGIVSAAHLCMIFQQKCSASYILLTDQMSLSGCLCYFLRYWSYMHCNCLLTRLWYHKFQNLPELSNEDVFIHDQKRQDKNLNILRMKSFEFEIKKHFSSFLKVIKKWSQTLDCTFKPQILELLFWGTVPLAVPDLCISYR